LKQAIREPSGPGRRPQEVRKIRRDGLPCCPEACGAGADLDSSLAIRYSYINANVCKTCRARVNGDRAGKDIMIIGAVVLD